MNDGSSSTLAPAKLTDWIPPHLYFVISAFHLAPNIFLLLFLCGFVEILTGTRVLALGYLSGMLVANPLNFQLAACKQALG